MEYTDGGAKFAITYDNGILKGTIMAFSGIFNDGYPVNSDTGLSDKHWHLCDGTNGTPDLRGRFILGANDNHAVGSTGGEEATGISIANLPPHSFSGTTSTNNLKGGFYGADYAHMGKSYGIVSKTKSGEEEAVNGQSNQNKYKFEVNATHNHTFTTNTLGEGTPHNNMPPFYTLAFIMKL